MRPLAIILVVVAMVAAGLTAFLAKRWLDGQAAAQAAAQPAAVIEVLVMSREIPVGAVLQDADFRYENWPASLSSPRLVTKAPGQDPKGQFVGQVARRNMAEGEPFSPSATFKNDNSGVLAGMLGAGMRAVSVAITNASAVSGFITPGDRVDVVMAADFRKADATEPGSRNDVIVRFAAETVLEDVKVLAIDQQITRGRDGSAIQGKTATLELTPKQAEIINAASMMGQLSLALRSLTPKVEAPEAGPGDKAVARPDPEFTSDVEASKAMRALTQPKPRAVKSQGGGAQVQINRAGEISTKSF